ncbi:DUF2958 domain-containing protein [Primorskyibacter aestuariivivens]|uniref:DUF2958 domain-containing protein n=1 Tax=Primorskyibacter aestuariivivens TaxID=1888912 RepID=UPI002300397F|nr:DUF2958 domain-containing protein [Primorskyibacter aestuariivivens]MDA7430646.1 DUF2958 domain-containing protein [Primorskyibacter aestuariivivens]
MELLPQPILDQLAANGRANQTRIEAGEDTIDHHPVAKLFTPDGGATWLLSETDPEDPDIAFGLCDLGLGYPELGSVRLSVLKAHLGRLGLPIERDLHFKASAPLSTYAERAREAGGIIA